MWNLEVEMELSCKMYTNNLFYLQLKKHFYIGTA